jgi:beta-N-acetylhexosaminidase
MSVTAAIYGLSGPQLTADEHAFIREARPWGFILFQRNCLSRAQVRRLTDDLREVAGRETLPILIDQEGGRVQRLKAPEWSNRPPMRTFGALYAQDPARGLEATTLNALLIAADLADAGVNVDCVPCLDVPVTGADDIIGDRAFAEDPQIVARLGRAVAEAMLSVGVLPVIKHIPGHGRAGLDTHQALPRVETMRTELARTDFVPFKALADMPLAMTAHVVYEAIDASACATLSAKLIRDIIRDEIGFNGLLMSDDLNMKALAGRLADRARGALKAGCDVALHCSGKLAEMQEIAGVVPALEGRVIARAQAAERLLRGRARPVAVADAARRLAELMG